MSGGQNATTRTADDTIIHIGAGRCTELPEYLAGNAARILLIEPHPQRAQELARRTADNEHVEVRAAAVTDDPTRTRLQLFNLADLSSLRTPTGAYQLFPGLKATGEVDVEAMTPAELLETGPFDANTNRRLVIDAPGEETAVVNALHEADQLAHFNRIILHCGSEPLYEDNAPAATLLDQLQEAGYDIEQQGDSDPDRPCWSLRRNPLRLENRTLRQQIAELEQQTKELSAWRDERSREAEERKQAQEALQQEKESLAQKNGELEQQTKKLTASRDELAREAEERKQAQEALQQEKESLEQKNGELAQQTKELTASRDEQANLAEERRQEIDRLTGERDEASARAKKVADNNQVQAKKLKEQERVSADAEKKAEERQARIVDLESELAEVRHRQGVTQEEISKAEGQINLIKELVLSESGL